MITWKNRTNEEVMSIAGGRPGNLINLIVQKYGLEEIESTRKSMRHTITTQLHEMKKKNYPKEVIQYYLNKYYSLPGVTRKKTNNVLKHRRIRK